MIPQIIHYCWFGPNPLPKSALRCIDSWKRHFPEYEIRQWDETNFDVDAIPYSSQAYSKGKYAFESISTKLNANYPNFELIVNSAERKELHLLILNDGTVYQMLDDLHFGNVIRIGSPELVLKYTNGENIYKVLKDAFNAQINQ